MRILEYLEKKIPEISLVDGEEDYWGRPSKYYIQTENILTIHDLYIEITATSTKGTIGKVTDIELNQNTRRIKNGDEADILTEYDSKFTFEVDGRKNSSSIKFQHCDILTDYTGPTMWVRNVKDRKQDLKNPVNKFGQMLNEGDWIIGVGQGYGAQKPLRFGRVTRWTNKNVWATMNYDAPKDERDEFQLANINETFLLPSTDHINDELMMAVVKGWDGT